MTPFDPGRAAEMLGELAAARFRSGYLSALPIHELKIDKSFVRDMLDNPAHLAIVRSIVDLGHIAATTTVAAAAPAPARRQFDAV